MFLAMSEVWIAQQVAIYCYITYLEGEGEGGGGCVDEKHK